MEKRVQNRLRVIVGLLIISSVGIYLILSNLEDNIVFFYPPSNLDQTKIEQITKSGNKIRVGGLVRENSITVLAPNKIRFIITDYKSDLTVEYTGILPALFREKQGIVAEGTIEDNIFIAIKLLTKHDENYIPPEIKDIVIDKTSYELGD